MSNFNSKFDDYDRKFIEDYRRRQRVRQGLDQMSNPWSVLVFICKVILFSFAIVIAGVLGAMSAKK